MARGYWTRLYARALFFQDANGSPLILVSCDFFAVPGGLAALVSQRIAEKWGKVGLSIPPEAIIISATHTHQGPGNYMTAGSYNQYGSKYPGFDRRLFVFLADRVTDAIDSAIVDARNGGTATLSVYSDSVGSGLLMNRSPITFMSNWNAASIMDRLNKKMPACHPIVEKGEAQKDWDVRGCPRLRSIDRTVTILEIKRGGSRIGLAVFLASHPTVLDHHAPFFSSDWTGTAVSTLERQLGRAAGHQPVVAFFNGAEGDVVARRGSRDLLDVVRLRDSLVKSLDTILRTSPKTIMSPSITTRQGFLVPDATYGTPSGSDAHIPKHPLMGTAGLGGPEEDRTSLFQLGFDAGHHEIPVNDQGGKLGALDSQLLPIRLTSLLAPDYTFPNRLPVTYAELGDLKLAAVPVELSTASGLMLRDMLHSPRRVEIIGLANEYSSYVATPDEYAVQDYMGASTLWGPNEMPILAWTVNCLSQVVPSDSRCAKLSRRTSPRVDEARFSPGGTPEKLWRKKNFKFGPPAIGERLNEVDDELDGVQKDRSGAPERNLPRFEWTETIHSDSAEFVAASEREVRILQREQGQWVPRKIPGTLMLDDDTGLNFLTLLREAPRKGSRDQRRWSVLWLAPILEESIPRGEYRFEVLSKRNGQVVMKCESLPFAVDLSPVARTTTIKPDGQCG